MSANQVSIYYIATFLTDCLQGFTVHGRPCPAICSLTVLLSLQGQYLTTTQSQVTSSCACVLSTAAGDGDGDGDGNGNPPALGTFALDALAM